jgi:hypothetical protein
MHWFAKACINSKSAYRMIRETFHEKAHEGDNACLLHMLKHYASLMMNWCQWLSKNQVADAFDYAKHLSREKRKMEDDLAESPSGKRSRGSAASEGERLPIFVRDAFEDVVLESETLIGLRYKPHQSLWQHFDEWVHGPLVDAAEAAEAWRQLQLVPSRLLWPSMQEDGKLKWYSEDNAWGVFVNETEMGMFWEEDHWSARRFISSTDFGHF